MSEIMHETNSDSDNEVCSCRLQVFLFTWPNQIRKSYTVLRRSLIQVLAQRTRRS